MKDLSVIFGPGGGLTRGLADYEYRPEQLHMAEAVAGSLESGAGLVVEAGTGTGKTLAYLIPAVLSGKQVVVSTATRNLQEQIFFKDIPFIRRSLGMAFNSVMLKGRSNYLCPLRLNRFAQRPLFKSADDAGLWDSLFGWAHGTKTGDRGELHWLPEETSIWPQICATTDFCNSQKCPRSTDCHISRLRKEAEQSQVIVVNHHLFFADLALREKGYGAVLPSYDAVIFDEAHNVEEIASSYFGFSVSNYRVDELVRDTMREMDELKPKNLKEMVKDLDNLESRSRNFFHSLRQSTDRRFSLSEVRPDAEAGEALRSSLVLMEEKISSLDKLTDAARGLAHRYTAICGELDRVMRADEDDFIFWGESRGGGVYLNASSIEVAPVLRDALYSWCNVIFTSATLTSGGEFTYFCSRLGLENVMTLMLPSPFDFKTQVTICIPKMPDPNSAAFLEILAERSLELIELVKGRTLLLFTSFRNMYEIRRRLAGKFDYPVFMQGDAPRHVLLEKFRENVDSVLFATSSFWQGVDVRGESLSCVIIDRLPFASPGDPITGARIERIRKKGGNPFLEYQVPEAVLELKQGLGRLIRHRNDKGIMMIADSRLKTKSYGKIFLDSLPPAPIVDSVKNIRWRG